MNSREWPSIPRQLIQAESHFSLLVLGEVSGGPVEGWDVDLLVGSGVGAAEGGGRAAVIAAHEAQDGLETKINMI